MFDPPVQRRKTIVMQRIQQAASRGYIFFTQGVVHYKKALSFANKMALKYQVNATENQRSYRKRKRQSNAFLYLYPQKDSEFFLWWILATEGEGSIHDEEKLNTIYSKHQRLIWDDDYELIVLPKENSKHTVTWRMTRSCYQQWNDRIRKSIRQKYSDDKARQAAWSLSRSPGFSGIRKQAIQLHKIYRAEWKRSRKAGEKMPVLSTVGYVRGLKSDTIPLSLAVRRINSGLRPFPNKNSKGD